MLSHRSEFSRRRRELFTKGEVGGSKVAKLHDAACKCDSSATQNKLEWLLQDDAETRGCEASNASNAFDLSVFSGLCSPTPEPRSSELLCGSLAESGDAGVMQEMSSPCTLQRLPL